MEQQKPNYNGGWWPVDTLDLTQPVEAKAKKWRQVIGMIRNSTLPPPPGQSSKSPTSKQKKRLAKGLQLSAVPSFPCPGHTHPLRSITHPETEENARSRGRKPGGVSSREKAKQEAKPG